MKSFFLLLVSVAFIFAGCDKLKQTTLGAQFIQNFTIDIDENSGTTQFNAEEVLNALSNEDIADVKESIVNYGIRNIKWKVWEYAGPQEVMVSGTVRLQSLSGENLYEYVLEESNLYDLSENPDHTDFPMTQDQKDVILAALLNDDQIRVSADGLVTDVPVHFVFQVVSDLTVTAEID
ncbi:MAG: hypothetical protein MK081_11130 [Flavobacteriales bacterium]|nr:hypothetical protein [Flavobacteriales bacterium]